MGNNWLVRFNRSLWRSRNICLRNGRAALVIRCGRLDMVALFCRNLRRFYCIWVGNIRHGSFHFGSGFAHHRNWLGRGWPGRQFLGAHFVPGLISDIFGAIAGLAGGGLAYNWSWRVLNRNTTTKPLTNSHSQAHRNSGLRLLDIWNALCFTARNNVLGCDSKVFRQLRDADFRDFGQCVSFVDSIQINEFK
jgi:hypothetical protein